MKAGDINKPLEQQLNRPYNIQIELVRGCNYSCSFCGNVSLPDKGKKYKFMSVETYKNLVSGLKGFGNRSRVQFAMRGEPTLHPDFIKYTKYIRDNLDGVQITVVSNGSLFDKQLITNFFGYGGNIAMIDCYGNTFEKYKKKYSFLKGKVDIEDFKDFNVNAYKNSKFMALVLVPDLAKEHKQTRTFTNQCDNISEATYKKFDIQKPVPGGLEKKCTNPFRELSIRFNGDVVLCCKDWTSDEGVIGNVNETSLYDLWYKNNKMNAMRELLLNCNRDFHPCDKCTYFGGFRQGFLPRVHPATKTKLNKLKKIARS